MNKYVVMCTIPFGIDDTYECEYSGVEHLTRWQADIELIEALNDDSGVQPILSARIEVIEE